MPATACPSAVDLRRVLESRADPSATAAVVAHVPHCPRCASAAAPWLDRPPPADPQVRALFDRLRAARPVGQTAAGSSPDAHTLPAPDRAAAQFLSPAQATDEIGRLDHYRVLKQLGQGGMGLVFLAEDSLLARPVALKVMQPGLATDPENRQRFLREARAAAALTHDHVVTIHQVGECNGAPYLAMQLLQGESLDDYLRRDKKLTIGHVCRIGRETATGLAAAHAHGLVHRDIKPANLWLEAPKGRVKILDFGLARTGGDVNLTGTGFVLGTPAYMSPEQTRAGPLDGRSDLWSLGVVLYRLCTGRMPFRGNEMIAVITAIALDNPPPPVEVKPDTPPALSELVMQLLAKDRDQRPKSAKEVADRLLRIERGLAKSARPGSSPRLTRPTTPEADTSVAPAATGTKRWPLIATATAASVLLLAGGIWLYRSVSARDKTGPTGVTRSEEKPPPPPLAPPVVTEWRPRIKAEPNFAVPSAEDDPFVPLVAYIHDDKDLMVLDAKRLWWRPAAGGAWQGLLCADACRARYNSDPVRAAVAPDGKCLALTLAPSNGQVGPGRLTTWDLTTGRLVAAVAPELDGPARAVAFVAPRQVGTAGGPRGVQAWGKMAGPNAPAAMPVLGPAATALAAGPVSGRLAFGTEAGEVLVRDRSSYQTVWTGRGPQAPVIALAWAAGGSRLISATATAATLWDAAEGRRIRDLPIGGLGLAVSPDGDLVAGRTWTLDGREAGLGLLEAATGRLLATSVADGHGGPAMAFSPDGKRLVSLGRDGVLRTWDVPAAVREAVAVKRVGGVNAP